MPPDHPRRGSTSTVDGRPIGFAVVGLEHFHAVEIAAELSAAGAVEKGHVGAGDTLADAYRALRPASPALDVDAVWHRDDIDIIVVAGVPSERGAVAVAALDSGRHVVSDKPGVTTAEDLDAVAAAEARSGRRWWVVFGERFGHPSVEAAVELATAGAIGRVVHVVGLGPHSLAAEHRPPWFWDPRRSGGILTDLGTHQIDQFCALMGGAGGTRSGDDGDGCDHRTNGRDDATLAAVEIVESRVGNVSVRSHRDMQDVGSFTLSGGGAVGHHRVDYLSPAGLGTWGDCRLTVVGTDATLEVRSTVDLDGRPGGDHLFVVDGSAVERVDLSDRRATWATRLLDDVATGGDSFCTRSHVHTVSALALEAQNSALRWPEP